MRSICCCAMLFFIGQWFLLLIIAFRFCSILLSVFSVLRWLTHVRNVCGGWSVHACGRVCDVCACELVCCSCVWFWVRGHIFYPSAILAETNNWECETSRQTWSSDPPFVKHFQINAFDNYTILECDSSKKSEACYLDHHCSWRQMSFILIKCSIDKQWVQQKQCIIQPS